MENWRFTVLRACRQGCFSSGLGDQRSSAPSQCLRLLHPRLPCVYALTLILHSPSPLMPGDAPYPEEWAGFISAPFSPLYPSTIPRAWYSNCSLNVCCKTETNKPALSTLSVLHTTFPFLQYVFFWCLYQKPGGWDCAGFIWTICLLNWSKLLPLSQHNAVLLLVFFSPVAM